MPNPFHLGWFVDGFRPPAWNRMWSGSSDQDWLNADFYVDFARALERAKFDFMLVADSAYIGHTYGGSSEAYLKQASQVPRHDPSALAPLLAQATTRLGLLPTLSTSEWRPFQVARYVSTLDHYSKGRMGWNLVTGGSALAAANYGVTAPPHDERYDIADEFAEVARALWDSWEPDSVVMDRETGLYADHTKVHEINYEGKYFKSRGPLNTLPAPQGQPVISQAGISPRGKDFAAKHADVVIGVGTDLAFMKSLCEDLHVRLAEAGRSPEQCKIMFVLEQPVLADTDEEAKARAKHMRENAEEHLLSRLCAASSNFQIDLSVFDLDQPIPEELTSDGHFGALKSWIASGRTLRELVGAGIEAEVTDRAALVGSPDTVAAMMGEFNEEIGGNGFLFLNAFVDRRYISEITDGLIPALQRRGLTRTAYEHDHLRDNLRAF